jgi:hypothetical protein
MSKQVKILLGLVIAALAIYFLYTAQPWRKLSKAEESNFAIEDTASIVKVFIADGRGVSSLLQKQADGSWTVNDEFKAEDGKVQMLLETIYKVKMRNPVSQSEFNNVVKTLTGTAVKVEFYNAKKLIKTIYVGHMTSDQTGTYMMMDGANSPYVTHVPGFVGYLSPYFLSNPVKWRNREVFKVPFESIAQVSVQYPSDQQQSFSVEKRSVLEVRDANGVVVPIADTNFVKYYLGAFAHIYAEGFDEILSESVHDSISKTIPMAIVTVKTIDGKTNYVKLHTKPVERSTKNRYDETGELMAFDTEKYYAFMNGDKNMMYIQEYNFGKLLKKLSDFKGK